MNKLDLSARALKQVSPRLTQDTKISLREMMYCVGNARDQIIKDNAWAKWSNGLEIVWDGMLSTFEAVSLTKKSECLYYAELPSKPLYLPKNMGIYQVVSNADPTNDLIPVSSTFYTMYKNQLAVGLDGYTGYYQNGNNIYIVGSNVTEETKLDLTLVCQSEDIGEYDYFPFPADMENEIIKMAIEQFVLTVQMPEDLSDNNRQDA